MRFLTRIGLPAAFAASAFFAAPASAQTLATESTTLSVNVPERTLVERLIENFDKSTALFQLNTVATADGTSGFTFGTSPFQFRVGEGFVLPSGVSQARVLGFDFYFASRADNLVSTSYTVEVVPAASLVAGPGATAVYSQTFNTADIQISSTEVVPTQVRFTAPPVVTGPFFAVVRFDQNVIGDSLAIGSTGQDTSDNIINNSWLYYNGSWRNVNALITSAGQPLQTYLWVDALINDNVVAEEPASQSRSVRLLGSQPNPARTSSTLTFELDRSLPVAVTVYDLLGREVASVPEQALAVGVQRISLDTSALQSGVYVYHVRAGDEVLTGRLTVVR